jgi:tetratricopeptide (TPR) repeat protein
MIQLFKKYPQIISFVLIALISIIAYNNTFEVPLQFDDGAHIVERDKIKKFENYTTAKHWASINNRPLAHFTLAVNYVISEMDTTSYHIFNLIIHILAGLIAFLLTREILSLPMFSRRYKPLARDSIALFTALIFVSHPIQTQAVTYIIQRMTSMAGLFYMLSVYLYILARNKQIKANSLQSGAMLLVIAGVAGVAGFLSKQSAVTFPLAWLLTELFFIRDRKGRFMKKYFRIATIMVLLITAAGLAYQGLPRETTEVSRGEYLMSQFKVYPKYLQLLVVPYGQNIDHHVIFPKDFFQLEIIGGLLLLLLTAAAGYFSYKKYRLVSYGIFWYFITASVESSIIPIRDALFEHRMYLPMFGFSLIVSDVLVRNLGKKKLAYANYALASLTVIYTIATISRNEVWQTTKSLWQDSVEKAPGKERNWYWLAAANLLDQNREEAMEAYNMALKNNPQFVMAWNARANLKKEINDFEGALKDYNQALELNPQYAKAYYNRGVLNAAMKEYDKAIEDYEKSIKFGYGQSAVYYNRANSKMKSGKLEEAIKDYNIAINKNPKYALAHYNRGLTKAKMGDHDAALKDIDLAIRFDPNNHLFYNGKGVSLISLRKYNEAIRNFNQAIKLKPSNGQAYYNRGYAKYFGLDDKEGACTDWQTSAGYNYAGGRAMLNKYCKN